MPPDGHFVATDVVRKLSRGAERPRCRSALPDAFAPLQRCRGRTDHFHVISIRAARRYRWRLAGGRLVADDSELRFVPNRLERRRADTHWQCAASHLKALRVRGRLWLVVDTDAGAESFRIFGAAAAAATLEQTLQLSSNEISLERGPRAE